MTELIKFTEYPVKDVLDKLLQDKSTKKNIVFATDNYRFCCGTGYSEYSYMTVRTVRGFSACNIQPRVYKSAYEQNERTRKKAEVFTPSWIVNKMNDFCDAEWFGRENVFTRENGVSWEITPAPIEFPEGKCWQNYVDSRRLEITCGEAPYIASRYDTTTGEIIPVERRIGILDRKLRVVSENATTEEEWLKWAVRAVQSVYGYEFQGDNLLIARINVLATFCDHLEHNLHRLATKTELSTIANIIAWNFWQMEGLKGIAPYGTEHEEWEQYTLYEKPPEVEDIKCMIYDWRAKCSMPFEKLKERGKGMKFDYVIGNPPYQDQSQGDKPADDSIYHHFMEGAYSISDKVELITPARFLFNNGNTPTKWNEKMLNDPHFKVMMYEVDSKKLFPNTDIKGGVAIHYRNAQKIFGAIGHFTAFKELNSILKKVLSKNETSITSIIYNQNKFNLDALYSDYPYLKSAISSDGKEKRLTSGCLAYDCFHDEEQENDVKILGLDKNKKRVYKYISRIYIYIYMNSKILRIGRSSYPQTMAAALWVRR